MVRGVALRLGQPQIVGLIIVVGEVERQLTDFGVTGTQQPTSLPRQAHVGRVVATGETPRGSAHHAGAVDQPITALSTVARLDQHRTGAATAGRTAQGLRTHRPLSGVPSSRAVRV